MSGSYWYHRIMVHSQCYNGTELKRMILKLSALAHLKTKMITSSEIFKLTNLICYNLKRKDWTKVLTIAMAMVTTVIMTSQRSNQGTEEGDLNNLIILRVWLFF